MVISSLVYIEIYILFRENFNLVKYIKHYILVSVLVFSYIQNLKKKHWQKNKIKKSNNKKDNNLLNWVKKPQCITLSACEMIYNSFTSFPGLLGNKIVKANVQTERSTWKANVQTERSTWKEHHRRKTSAQFSSNAFIGSMGIHHFPIVAMTTKLHGYWL